MQKEHCELLLTASGIVISLIRILSILWLNIFQRIWFCTVWTEPLLWLGPPVVSSGMCKMFLSSSRLLLMFERCNSDSLPLCSPSTFFFKKSTTTLVARWSTKADFVDVSKLFMSNTICLPKSVLEITSTESKHSIGIVKFTKIVINNFIVVSSLAWSSRGMISLFIFCPKLILRR